MAAEERDELSGARTKTSTSPIPIRTPGIPNGDACPDVQQPRDEKRRKGGTKVDGEVNQLKTR